MSAPQHDARHFPNSLNGANSAWQLSVMNTAEVDALVDPTGARTRLFTIASWVVVAVGAVAFGASAALVL